MPEVVTEEEEVEDVVTEEEVVEDVSLLRLLTSQTTDLSATADSGIDMSPPSLDVLFVSILSREEEEARSFGTFFLRIFKGFSGNLIK